jgi:alpha-glucoside transport system ATP-binding protein
MTLADRIVVLSAGHIEQVGPPLELYERPANLFVAQFIGSPAMNIVPVTISETGDVTRVSLSGGAAVSVPIATASGEKGKPASFGVRPEDLTLTTGEDYLFEGTVDIVEALGEVTLLYLEDLTDGEPLIAKLPGIVDIRKGQKVRLAADGSKLHLFDGNGKTYRR